MKTGRRLLRRPPPAVSGVLLLLLSTLGTSAGCGVPAGAEPVALPLDAATLLPEADFVAQVDRTMGRRDVFPILRDPPLVPASQARRMQPEERVLGLDLGATQVAYPILYLNFHEIVEHTVAGRELLVCYCPLCGTGAVHSRRIGGDVLSFGHSGWLWRNAFLLYDVRTDSLWHHATGVAMSGPMRGTRLPRFLATAQMTFDAWRSEHPGTLVMEKPEEGREEEDVYAERNRHMTFGLSVEAGAKWAFYPQAEMPDLAAVEDEVGSVPLLVVRDVAAGYVAAFDRRVDGRTLSFDALPGRPPRLRERGGAREWSIRGGSPVAGTGATASLRPLPSTPWEQNAWQLAHPDGATRHPR